MAVYLLVRQNGQHARVQFAPDNALPHGVDAGDVIFAVRSAQPERSEAIAGAVSDVFNLWCIQGGQHALRSQAGVSHIREFHDDQPSFGHYTGRGAHYVYAYAHSQAESGWHRNHVFYVGMGRNGRYLQHLTPPAIAGAYKSRKVQRIQLALGHPPWNACAARVVRHLAAFVGLHAEERAAAVERFLITYHFGVYRLTNRTGGNSQHALQPDRWMALPSGVTVFDEWRELLRILMDGQEPAVAQTLRRGLTARAVSAQAQWNLSEITVGPRRLIRAKPEGDLFTSDGTDVASEHLLAHDNRPVMRLQFRMSETDAAFRINLRPLHGERANFAKLIAAMFFGNDLGIAERRIKNRGRKSFFKPCAAGGAGKHDIDFDCADLDTTYRLVDASHFGRSVPWCATLHDILREVVSRTPEPACRGARSSGPH